MNISAAPYIRRTAGFAAAISALLRDSPPGATSARPRRRPAAPEMHDRQQLGRRVPGDERPEGLAVADLREVARDRADDHAVRAEEPDRADAEGEPAGEGLEADAHVVPDVEAEHRQAGVGLAHAQALVARVVHAVELRDLLRREQVVHELGVRLQHRDQQAERAEEQQPPPRPPRAIRRAPGAESRRAGTRPRAPTGGGGSRRAHGGRAARGG